MRTSCFLIVITKDDMHHWTYAKLAEEENL